MIRSPSVIWDSVDGTTVLCDLATGEFFELNDTAAMLWEVCQGQSLPALVETLLDRYPEVDRLEAAADCRQLIAELQQSGLIAI